MSYDTEADVIVVGAGPGGCSTAYHLARHGARVLLLEKSSFPREKVCGDGLTPTGVRQVRAMGVPVGGAGWTLNRGVRFLSSGAQLQLDWPDIAGAAGVGATRSRLDLDALLAERAVAAGAQLLTRTAVTGPVLDETGSRAVGVTALVGPEREPRSFRGRLVVAATGVSARLPTALGVRRRPGRPIGVAVRGYYRSARHDDPYLDVIVDIAQSGHPGQLVPGYGWLFGMGDGRVNAGLAVYDSAGRFSGINHRAVFTEWLRTTPRDWGLNDAAAADGPLLGGAIPMGFTRLPHYRNGLLLVGDCGGMANPFTGEGIAYAMEAGALAAEIAVRALAQPAGAQREATLQQYCTELSRRYGSYYRLGRRFVRVIDNNAALRLAVRHVVPRPALMRVVLKLMTNMADPRSRDAEDRLITLLQRLTPTR